MSMATRAGLRRDQLGKKIQWLIVGVVMIWWLWKIVIPVIGMFQTQEANREPDGGSDNDNRGSKAALIVLQRRSKALAAAAILTAAASLTAIPTGHADGPCQQPGGATGN